MNLPDDWLEFAKEMNPNGDNLLRQFCEEPPFRTLVNDKIVREYGLMAECAVTYAIARGSGRTPVEAFHDACCEWDL